MQKHNLIGYLGIRSMVFQVWTHGPFSRNERYSTAVTQAVSIDVLARLPSRVRCTTSWSGPPAGSASFTTLVCKYKLSSYLQSTFLEPQVLSYKYVLNGHNLKLFNLISTTQLLVQSTFSSPYMIDSGDKRRGFHVLGARLTGSDLNEVQYCQNKNNIIQLQYLYNFIVYTQLNTNN